MSGHRRCCCGGPVITGCGPGACETQCQETYFASVENISVRYFGSDLCGQDIAFSQVIHKQIDGACAWSPANQELVTICDGSFGLVEGGLAILCIWDAPNLQRFFLLRAQVKHLGCSMVFNMLTSGSATPCPVRSDYAYDSLTFSGCNNYGTDFTGNGSVA
jgi:hypothetical protein